MQDLEITFNKNEDAMKLLKGKLQQKLDQIYLGGGQKRIDKHHAKGKLTARERIELLTDENAYFLELGALAGDGMYVEYGGAPGAWFPVTGKKNLRAQEVAIENRLPLIYLVDSAGVFLPMQDEIFPDKEHFGRIFRNNAVISSMGIPQIAAIMGSCVAGGAYLPIMSDEALIVDGTGSVFLAGPYLVKSAIGEEVDIETLGGATTHCEISGVTDYKMPDDETCLKTIRDLVDKFGETNKAGFSREKPAAPQYDTKEVYGIFPENGAKPYEMRELLKRIIDKDSFTEYKKGYGQSIVCGYARVEGWAVGIVANQREIVKSKKGEMQFGGVIYSDSADKAARFIMNCNQKKIPLVFLQDVTGFMVGSRSEQGGIIKDGAKLVSAVSNSVVPKFTFVIGNSYGAGNYAMCGKAYDPRLIFAWPTAKIAVMGGSQAAKTLLQIQVSAKERKGETISDDEKNTLLQKITDKYDEQTSPYYAAARLWVDGIIDPAETRKIISIGIEAANEAPITKEFNAGVLQT